MSKNICPKCQSKMVWGRHTIHYNREEVPITLKNV